MIFADILAALNQLPVLIFLAFLLGCVLARFLPLGWAYGLPGLLLSGRLIQEEYVVFLASASIGLFAYLIGSSFPWRNLEIVRGKMYKLFFSVILAYALLLGAAALVFWRLGWLATLRPWLIYFTLAFGLISAYEPWEKMLSISVRGPLSLVLQHLGALSSVFTTFCLIFLSGLIPVLKGIIIGAVFFGAWFAFIRIAKLSPRSMMVRTLQFGFLFWLATLDGVSLPAGALSLGVMNALTGIKLINPRLRLDLWKILTALIFFLVLGTQKLEFTWLALGIAALIWILRFVIFHLYNIFAHFYSFGNDFVRHINFGLQVNDCRILLNVYILCPVVMPVVLLVMLFEQLLYPLLLKRALVQSGETSML